MHDTLVYRIFHLARCLDCDGDFELPFGDETERDAWAAEHSEVRDPFTGALHQVQVATVRRRMS